jgi:glycosyltransferase involved in cell wall biosynthesis
MKIRPRRFCTIFPNYQDFHFYKDPGQIPYRFSRVGYQALLVCYGRDKELIETEKYLTVKKLPESYFARKFNTGMVFFLLFNSRKIDILNTFHLTWSSLLFIFIYRLLNKKGFAYLKLDTCAFAVDSQLENFFKWHEAIDTGRGKIKNRLKNRISKKYFLDKVDLWSVEDDCSREIYEAKYDFLKRKVITVYNGHTADLPGSADLCRFEDKEDIILTAGRIGTYQKATEILLEAFKMIAGKTTYNLHLAGPVEPAFKPYIEKYMLDNPSLYERVIFHGSLGREELYSLYSRSRIFCMPSRFEGMALVFPESMYYANAIVTTGYVSLKCLIDRYGFGFIVDKDNPKKLSEALLDLVNDMEKMENMGQLAHEVSSDLLNWDTIIRVLLAEIEHRQSNGIV